jgi:hypothetical protein
METDFSDVPYAPRIKSECPNNARDYMDGENRRIFIDPDNFEIIDKVFEDFISFRLPAEKPKINILNCEFKKGFHIHRSNKKDPDYIIFVYQTTVHSTLNLSSYDGSNTIDLDNCLIDQLHVSGRSKAISLYKCRIGLFKAEYEKCEVFRVEDCRIDKYSLFKFHPYEVNFDSDDLAIKDNNRFVVTGTQTKKEVSGIYHSMVLKSARSIKASREINYQLNKATSERFFVTFGYFYKPYLIILWMATLVLIYALVYKLAFNHGFGESLYFSVYTFLTIGFGDLDNIKSYPKTLLVFSEGILGVTYTAALLVSIINCSKKGSLSN